MYKALLCSYCDKPADTRDHIIPKGFLEKPYPENLPTIPACARCNQSYSLDEEYCIYLADFLLSVSETDGDWVIDKANKIYEHQARRGTILLEKRMLESISVNEGRIYFTPETERVKRIAKKIAVGLINISFQQALLPENCHTFVAYKPFTNLFHWESLKQCLTTTFQSGRFSYGLEETAEGDLIAYVLILDAILAICSIEHPLVSRSAK